MVLDVKIFYSEGRCAFPASPTHVKANEHIVKFLKKKL